MYRFTGEQQRYSIKPKEVHVPSRWNIIRLMGRDVLSEKAQLKLEWIIFYYTVGRRKKVPTARHFGISPKTLHKWITRFDDVNLSYLEERRRTPKRVRTWMVTEIEEQRIKALRKENLKFGKRKLKELYSTRYQETISTWKIERVVRAHNLYPQKNMHAYLVEKRAKNKAKVRIHSIRETIADIHHFGFLWHIDAVIIWWYGVRKVIFTAIENHTRIAYAQVYKSNTSSFAEDFLRKLHMVTGEKIRMMHSDNGSEFAGAFQKACQTLGILQIYSRAYTPKDNAVLERFNRTIQEEWLEQSVVGLDDIREANNDLLTWLIHYNSIRPHQALDYQTPLKYAQENFFKVVPMWSASTSIWVFVPRCLG